MPRIIESTVDIARAPQDVFDFVSDPAHLPEWQPTVDDASFDSPGVPTEGTTGREVRRVLGGPQTFPWVVTECEPGWRWGIRVTDGPVRAHVTVTFGPSVDGSGTHVEYAIWFEGHGIGKVIRLLATQGARREVPANLALLKQQLEATNARA
jgi:uncharacterized protein YndB with AHSA1/START domain